MIVGVLLHYSINPSIHLFVVAKSDEAEFRSFAAIGMVDGAAFGGGGHAAQSRGGGELDELVDEGHFAHDVDGVGRSLDVVKLSLASLHIFICERDDAVEISRRVDGRKGQIANFAEVAYGGLLLFGAPFANGVVGEVEEHGIKM